MHRGPSSMPCRGKGCRAEWEALTLLLARSGVPRRPGGAASSRLFLASLPRAASSRQLGGATSSRQPGGAASSRRPGGAASSRRFLAAAAPLPCCHRAASSRRLRQARRVGPPPLAAAALGGLASPGVRRGQGRGGDRGRREEEFVVDSRAEDKDKRGERTKRWMRIKEKADRVTGRL